MSAPKSSDPPTWKVKTDVGGWIWLVTAGLSLYLWPTTLVITSLTFKVKSFHFVCALNHIICSRLMSNCELPPPHHFSLLSYNFKCVWSFSFWHIWFQSNNSRPNSRTTKARVRGVVGGFPSPDDCVFLCTYLRVCSSQQKLCKACWPRGDQLHNGHHSNRLPKMSPFRAPQLWVCVCVWNPRFSSGQLLKNWYVKRQWRNLMRLNVMSFTANGVASVCARSCVCAHVYMSVKCALGGTDASLS